MIIEPFFRAGVSATAHPDGCQRQVADWVARVSGNQVAAPAPARVLVIGCSGGIGLASRIAAAFSRPDPAAGSIGLAWERPGTERRPGTAGWYRSVAFEDAAAAAGLRSRTVVGDAFDDAVKVAVTELVAAELGQLDLVLYSVAAPRRRDRRTGAEHRSVIKTIGEPFQATGYDLGRGTVAELTMPAASTAEIAGTVAVMGGDDFARWLRLLAGRQLLAPGARCLALSYVGCRQLWPTYRGGTLGAAKDDLERTARQLDGELAGSGVSVQVAVLRALITQSSMVIPMNALYTMLLMRVLAERQAGEDVLDQAARLVGVAGGAPGLLDEAGRLRLDDREQHPDVQRELWRRWPQVRTENLAELAAHAEFQAELQALYGFGVAGVDYRRDVDPVRSNDRLVLL